MNKLALPILTILTLAAPAAQAELLCQRWAGKATPATYNDALQIVQGGKGVRLVFDLKAIPKGAKVHRASLHCFTAGDIQPNDPALVYVAEKVDADGSATPAAKPLVLEAPWYHSFNVTAAVSTWAADPARNLGFVVGQFDKLQANRSYLEVLYETGSTGVSPVPAKDTGLTPVLPKGGTPVLPAQVTDIKAVHHDGQTFIVWKEVPDYQPKPGEVIWLAEFNESGDKLAEGPGQGEFNMPNHPGITLEALRRLQGLAVRREPSGIQGIKPLKREREVPPITYRIYRHAEKITPANFKDAAPIAEVQPLAGYDGDVYAIDFKGEYIDQREIPTSPIPTYCYDKGKHLAPGENMYVHSLPANDKGGKFFYAVTSALGGTENAAAITDANSTPQAVEESYAPPKPVLQWVQKDRYKTAPASRVNVPEYWYRFWAGPPYYHLPCRSLRIAMSVPEKFQPPGPMIIGAISDTFNVRGALNMPSEQAVTLEPEQLVGWMPDLFYNEGRGTLRGMSECKVDYFQERYMDYIIKWAWTLNEIDKNKITGSNLYFGLRHPEIFSTMSFGAYTADYDRRWCPGSGSMPGLLGPKGIKTVDGDDAWDMFSVSGYVNKYVGRDIPFLICISAVGKDSGHTSEFGWQDDPRGWAGLLKARQTFVASWSLGPPHELSAAFAKMRWDVTIPAFANCSLDNNPGNGDPPDGDYYGCINGWLLWGDQDSKDDESIKGPVDEKDRWEMTVYVISSCPDDRCTVDITPRHTRLFKPKEGDKFKWTNTSVKDGKVLSSGQASADKYGLVTLPAVEVNKGKNRIVIAR